MMNIILRMQNKCINLLPIKLFKSITFCTRISNLHSNFLSNELILKKVEKPILCHFLNSVDCALPGSPEPELLAHSAGVFWLTGVVMPVPGNLQHKSHKSCRRTAAQPPTLLLTIIIRSARVFSWP